MKDFSAGKELMFLSTIIHQGDSSLLFPKANSDFKNVHPDLDWNRFDTLIRSVPVRIFETRGPEVAHLRMTVYKGIGKHRSS